MITLLAKALIDYYEKIFINTNFNIYLYISY